MVKMVVNLSVITREFLQGDMTFEPLHRPLLPSKWQVLILASVVRSTAA